MRKNALVTIARMTISFSLIGLIVYLYRDKGTSMAHIFINARHGVIVSVLLLTLVMECALALRIRLVLRAQEIFVSFHQALTVVMLGFFCCNFIPSMIGADIIKATYLSHLVKNIKGAVTSIFVDRLSGLFVLVILAMGMSVYAYPYLPSPMVVWGIWGVGCGVFLFVLLCFSRPLARLFRPFVRLMPSEHIRQHVYDLYFKIHCYRERPRCLVKFSLLSVVSQLGNFSLIYLLTIAVGVHVPYTLFIVFMAVISVAVIAPSINGLGIREIMFVTLFSPYCGKEHALAIALLMDLMVVYMGVIGGLYFSLFGQVRLSALRTEAATLKQEGEHE